jgi:hypothetical protein
MTASQSALQSIPLPDGPYLSIGLEAQYSQAQAENMFNFAPGGAIRENDPNLHRSTRIGSTRLAVEDPPFRSGSEW